MKLALQCFLFSLKATGTDTIILAFLVSDIKLPHFYHNNNHYNKWCFTKECKIDKIGLIVQVVRILYYWSVLSSTEVEANIFLRPIIVL